MNADLIKFVESAPDTVITLSTGEKVVVMESVEQIIDLVVQFRRLILAGIPCPAMGISTGGNSPPGNPNQELELHHEIGHQPVSLQVFGLGQK